MMTTFTGRHVNPLELCAEDVHIEDIAHALALCNRFAGHTKNPVSVAQHSVFVARLSGEDGLQGLLHDASDAYIGDMTRWLKHHESMTVFRVVENRIMDTILTKYGCSTCLSKKVRDADKLMLRFEGYHSFADWRSWRESLPDNYGPLTAEEIDVVGHWWPWAWQYAETAFLNYFRSLAR
jgi:hypothetical protein